MRRWQRHEPTQLSIVIILIYYTLCIYIITAYMGFVRENRDASKMTRRQLRKRK